MLAAVSPRTGRRRPRNNSDFIVLGVVVLIAGVLFVRWWRDPQRAIDAARPTLDRLRAQYCKVYGAEKARPVSDSKAAPGAERLRVLGYYFFDMEVSSYDERSDANTDTIDLTDLAAMCEGTPSSGITNFRSQLAKLLAPHAGKDARLDSVTKLLVAMQRVRYLFVARTTAFTPSVAVGENGLLPGNYAGTAAIYRLQDGALIAAASVKDRAPEFATVYGMRGAYGGIDERDVSGSLRADTSLAYERAFEGAFLTQGLTFEMK
jgi:hypothetical protein